MLLTLLVEFFKTAVELRADRQPEFVSVDEEIRLRIGIVERIDDRNGLPRAVRRRGKIVCGLQIARGVSRGRLRWKTGAKERQAIDRGRIALIGTDRACIAMRRER